MRRFVLRSRSILVAALLTVSTLVLTASAVLADGTGGQFPH